MADATLDVVERVLDEVVARAYAFKAVEALLDRIGE